MTDTAETVTYRGRRLVDRSRSELEQALIEAAQMLSDATSPVAIRERSVGRAALFNRGDTRTPSHLKERAQRLRDQAASEPNAQTAANLRRMAEEAESEARKASRLR